MSDVTTPWTWRFAEAGTGVLDRPGSPGFTTRYEAEEWLGLHWRALREQGASTAVLLHAGAVVPPMYDLAAVPEQMTFPVGVG